MLVVSGKEVYVPFDLVAEMLKSGEKNVRIMIQTLAEDWQDEGFGADMDGPPIEEPPMVMAMEIDCYSGCAVTISTHAVDVEEQIDLIGGEIIANLTAKVDRNGDVYIETQDGKTVLYQKKP